MYKIAHNYYDKASVESLFDFSTNKRLRGHDFKIVKKFANKSKYHKFFTNRVVNKWNELPTHIVNSKTINDFKNSFDKYNKDINFKIDIHYFD